MSTARYLIAGESNRIDPLNISMDPNSRQPLFTDWAKVVNVDLDDFSGCSLRKGYVLDAPGTMHSCWSNPYDPQEAYFVEGTALKMRSVSGEVSTLRLGITAGLRMCYVQVNDVVFYSNGAERGIIEQGVAVAPFVPTDPFKLPFPAGRCLEWHNGRLFTFVHENGSCALICSDSLDTPGGVESMDDRQCIVAQFKGVGTMIQRVESSVGGMLFVSAGGATYLLPGSDPVVGENLGQYLVDPHGAVFGSNVPVKASLVGKGGTGTGALWVASDRICYGAPSGELAILDKLAVPYATEGTGLIREQNGTAHYLFTLSGLQGTGNVFVPAPITVD